MRSESSLPSLIPNLSNTPSRTSNYTNEQSRTEMKTLPQMQAKAYRTKSLAKLFQTPTEYKEAKNHFTLLMGPPQQNKPTRSVIHFTTNIESGFTSFRQLSKRNEGDLFASLQALQTQAKHVPSMKKQLLAQIMLNKINYSKYAQYMTQRKVQLESRYAAELQKMQPKPTKYKSSYRAPPITHTKAISLRIDYTEYEHSRTSMKPYIDYEAMPSYNSTERKVYFVGGRLSSDLLPYYDISSHTYGTMRRKIKCFGETQGTCIGGELWFYGGINFYSVGLSECNSGLLRVGGRDESNREWEKEDPRTFHAQCAYGDYLLVSGGYTTNNRLLNTIAAYHTKKHYWTTLSLEQLPKGIRNGYAKHKMVAVMHERARYQIYEQEKIVKRKDMMREGVYMFGGEAVGVDHVQYMPHIMYVMEIGHPNIRVVEAETKGVGPGGRKNFGMTYTSHFIVIHGGVNEVVLNEMKVLELRYMEWIGMEGDMPTRRHSHVLVGDDDFIIILGGKNQEGLCKEVLKLHYSQL